MYNNNNTLRYPLFTIVANLIIVIAHGCQCYHAMSSLQYLGLYTPSTIYIHRLSYNIYQFLSIKDIQIIFINHDDNDVVTPYLPTINIIVADMVYNIIT